MNKKERHGLRTWIEIDRKAIRQNIKAFRSLISRETKLCAVVKSNAYGHGLVDFSREAERFGVDMIAVDSMVEARRLRKEGISVPLLVLCYTLSELFSEAEALDVALSISSFDSLRRIVKEKKPVKIHIKVDTGMSRLGFAPEEMKQVVSFLHKHRTQVYVEGLFTHFAAAKNPAFPAETRAQIETFTAWKQAFADAGFSVIAHAAATSGTILFPEAHFDMVRIGIGLYGLWPSTECRAYALGTQLLDIKPVMQWKTVVGEIKTIKKGSGVGYDFTEHVARDTWIAICPIGYWHGYDRRLSSIGQVYIRGKRARVIGRVSMNMIIVDVTDIPGVRQEDEVELVGKYISIEEISQTINMSWYEFATRINPLIRKICY